jgi:hypothetical protein
VIKSILVPASGSSSDEVVFVTALAAAKPCAAHRDAKSPPMWTHAHGREAAMSAGVRAVEVRAVRARGGPHVLELPAAQSAGRRSLTSLLSQRRTTREVSDQPLPLQTLSTLLWGAWGVNRKRGPFGLRGRTGAMSVRYLATPLAIPSSGASAAHAAAILLCSYRPDWERLVENRGHTGRT